MKLYYALIGLFLVSFAFAEALLVTVEYNYGEMSIAYVELLSGPEPGYTSDGEYILAYETASGTIPGTAFYMPLITSTQEEEIFVSEEAEQTLTIPYGPGASSLSLYDREGNLLASFDLSGISNAGDYKGKPPSESIAGKSGQPSVSGAVEEALRPDAETSSVPGAGAGTYSPEEGCCMAFALLFPLLAFAFGKRG